jgi:hypothetical protein
MEWVLILFFLQPNDQFIGKQAIILPNAQSCQRAKTSINTRPDPMPMKVLGICVTRQHWEGKVQDPNMALD